MMSGVTLNCVVGSKVGATVVSAVGAATVAVGISVGGVVALGAAVSLGTGVGVTLGCGVSVAVDEGNAIATSVSFALADCRVGTIGGAGGTVGVLTTKMGLASHAASIAITSANPPKVANFDLSMCGYPD
jgi:hypothetical protein